MRRATYGRHAVGLTLGPPEGPFMKHLLLSSSVVAVLASGITACGPDEPTTPTCTPDFEQTVSIGVFNDSMATRIFTLTGTTNAGTIALFGPQEMRAGQREELASLKVPIDDSLQLQFVIDATYGARLIDRATSVQRDAPRIRCTMAYGEPARGPQAYPTCETTTGDN